jgi:hypothetical protein
MGIISVIINHNLLTLVSVQGAATAFKLMPTILKNKSGELEDRIKELEARRLGIEVRPYAPSWHTSQKHSVNVYTMFLLSSRVDYIMQADRIQPCFKTMRLHAVSDSTDIKQQGKNAYNVTVLLCALNFLLYVHIHDPYIHQ